ncbi:flagellin [Tuberibacillus calidus]|uniref:flagellin N-terminal helical domain-containing protein n=1 Tax=Tuberibacillus calidus TaxID=340097 RepID=UPI0003F70E8C|nr:flagellin [Tuberibacillus calidus]
MIINHNIAALNTIRQLSVNATNTQKALEKLSSGLRINSAADDAAGLAISEKMRGQIRGLDMAQKNAQDGISLIQTAEGALNETHSILQRMRELAVQASNGTTTDSDRQALQDELNQLTSEINRIGNTTEFNTQKLLNGGIGSTDGAKITAATSAVVNGGTHWEAADITKATGTIKVDGTTFDISNVLNQSWTKNEKNIDNFINELNNVTAGGVKLSDVVKIENDGGAVKFTAKSEGATSSIQLSVNDDSAAKMLGYANAETLNAVGEVHGTPTTMERHGIEASKGLDSVESNPTIAANSTFTVQVGSESAVTVTLKNAKTYDTKNADPNVAQAAMEDLVKDLNAALQDAGLSDKVTASLSADNKVQFISETGKDIVIADGANTPLVGQLGFSGSETVKNVQQVVGPGAQGSGFSTSFQIGANTGQSMSLTIDDMRAAALGITGNAGQQGFTSSNSVTNGTNDIKTEAALNISTKDRASAAIDVLDSAIEKVSSERAKLGAVQNRLEHTINNLGTASQNLTAAESRIRDVDYALAA